MTVASHAVDAMSPHLAMWREVDPESPPDAVRAWLDRATVGVTTCDLHRRFVERIDGPAHGDSARVARYFAALDQVRAHVDGGGALTLDAISEAQGVALGFDHPAPLRTTDAFARGGAHRYPHVDGFDALVRSRFEAWASSRAHPVSVACGRYLDVIFTHPFCDGNARSARLCLDATLRAAGLATPRLEDLVLLRKTSGGVAFYWRMVRLCAARSAHADKDASP